MNNSVGTDPEAQRAVFRAALLQNVIEPGAVPGAPALVLLTDLMELPIAATWLTPIASVIKNVFATPTGYKVLGEVVPPNTHDGDWVVLARVLDVATGEQVDVSTHRYASDVHACRTAGYWQRRSSWGVVVALPVGLAGTRALPDALATYNNVESSTPGDLADLKRAVNQAPSSGVLLMLLASRYDLQGNHLAALSLYARAVAAHPRHPALSRRPLPDDGFCRDAGAKHY